MTDLALHTFYCVGPSLTLMVKWPISGLRISAFKKLLNRMCLYISVIIEGLLERKLYPSNSSLYQVWSACTLVVQFLLISLTILVLYILILTHASLHTHDLKCCHVPVWNRKHVYRLKMLISKLQTQRSFRWFV